MDEHIFTPTHSIKVSDKEPTDCVSRVVRVAYDSNTGSWGFRFHTVWADGEEPVETSAALGPKAFAMMMQGIASIGSTPDKWEMSSPQPTVPSPTNESP